MANNHPLYANRWYRQLSSTQLRQEIQNLYLLLGEGVEPDELDEPILQPPSTVEWDFGSFGTPTPDLDVDFGTFTVPLALNANFGGF